MCSDKFVRQKKADGYLRGLFEDKGLPDSTARVILTGRDLWIALGTGFLLGYLVYLDRGLGEKIAQCFPAFLTISGFLFGFTFSSFTSFMKSAQSWKDDKPYEGIANQVAELHIWSLIWLQLFLAYSLVLTLFDAYLPSHAAANGLKYGILAFLLAYSWLQIVYHAIVAYKLFRMRKTLYRSNSASGQELANSSNK